VAGGDGAAAAVLARRRELERLQEAAPDLAERAAAARTQLRQAEAVVKQAQADLREGQSWAEAARLEHQAQLREADRRNGDVQRAIHRVGRLRDEAARVERELAAAVEGLRLARELRAADVAPGAGAAPETEGELAAAQEAVQALEQTRRAAEQAVTEHRVRLAEQEQRLQQAGAAARRAADGGVFLDRRRAALLREQGELTAESEQRRLSFATFAGQVADAQGAVRQAREELARAIEARAARTAELNAARTGAQALEARLRELMERSHRAEVELTAVNSEHAHLGRQWVDAVAAAQPDPAEGEERPVVTVEGLLSGWEAPAAESVLSGHSDPEAEIARLRRQIRALGAVNPEAVEQYAEASERFEFLTGQRADLESAREQLEGAIAEIDAASRETFLAAFHEIAAAFDVMFKKLFGGGATELRLTDPGDVLETGVDIIVQPPGKKQQNLLLLSGGERALTATAMLFALLTVRPSPFCVMDEVDAPLDESNVRRFATTLREFSERTQFIVVTHNRGTMEEADTLYGVTMEERGVSKILSCSLADPVVAQIEAEHRGAPVG